MMRDMALTWLQKMLHQKQIAYNRAICKPNVSAQEIKGIVDTMAVLEALIEMVEGEANEKTPD